MCQNYTMFTDFLCIMFVDSISASIVSHGTASLSAKLKSLNPKLAQSKVYISFCDYGLLSAKMKSGLQSIQHPCWSWWRIGSHLFILLIIIGIASVIVLHRRWRLLLLWSLILRLLQKKKRKKKKKYAFVRLIACYIMIIQKTMYVLISWIRNRWPENSNCNATGRSRKLIFQRNKKALWSRRS